MHGRTQPPPSPRSPKGKPVSSAVLRPPVRIWHRCQAPPQPPMETVLLLRLTLLTVAIRREILSVLATSDAITVPTATAHVAATWTARRRRLGESPSAVQTAQTLVCQ